MQLCLALREQLSDVSKYWHCVSYYTDRQALPDTVLFKRHTNLYYLSVLPKPFSEVRNNLWHTVIKILQVKWEFGHNVILCNNTYIR
jgi:hypothetical protein